MGVRGVRRLAIVAIGLAVVSGGCAVADLVVPTPEVPTLPGPFDELPDGVSEGASWGRAELMLPDGVDPDARYATADEAFIALVEPFGRVPMPPGAAGIESHTLSATTDEQQILTTYPVFGSTETWGEQVLLILRHDHTGWGIHQAWIRRLCTGTIDHTECVPD
jgi:hypothetical protein